MPGRDDQLRAQFAEEDPVRFPCHGILLDGTILRTNPKRAVVRCPDGEYTVPYGLLQPADNRGQQRIARLESIRQSAEAALRKHGLKGWKFRFDHSTRRAGSCSYRDRTVTLSINLALRGGDSDIHDTILHEIAHALAGRRHNHDAAWQAKARKIGCSGARTHRLEFAPPRWRVRCENHCWSHTAQRRNRHLVCRRCGGRLVYTAYP